MYRYLSFQKRSPLIEYSPNKNTFLIELLEKN